MLLKIFRSNQPYTVFFVLFLALAFCIPTFLGHFNSIETSLSPIRGLFDMIPNNSWVIGGIQFILLFLGAISVNHVFSREEFLPESNYLSAMWYLMLLSPVLHSGWSIPILTGNIFLFISLIRLLKVFRLPRALAEYFECGFWLGIASLSFMPFLFILPLIFLAIIYTRTFNFREVFMPLVGALIPWLYLFSIRFILGNHQSEEIIDPAAIETSTAFSSPVIYGFLFLAGLQLIFSLYTYINSYKRSTNRSKNTKSVYLIWSIGASVAIIPLALHSMVAALLILGLGFSLIMGFGSLKMKRDWLPKSINTLMILIIVYDIWLKCQ